MATKNEGPPPDKREKAREVNKPVAPKLPHTGMDKFKDKQRQDELRGRGSSSPKSGGNAVRRGGQRGR